MKEACFDYWADLLEPDPIKNNIKAADVTVAMFQKVLLTKWKYLSFNFGQVEEVYFHPWLNICVTFKQNLNGSSNFCLRGQIDLYIVCKILKRKKKKETFYFLKVDPKRSMDFEKRWGPKTEPWGTPQLRSGLGGQQINQKQQFKVGHSKYFKSAISVLWRDLKPDWSFSEKPFNWTIITGQYYMVGVLMPYFNCDSLALKQQIS